jgi:outer membrane immunogenic protein
MGEALAGGLAISDRDRGNAGGLSMSSRAFIGGLVFAAGTAVSICSAAAADLPVRPAPAPAAPVTYGAPAYNWTGFYVGGHIGGAYGASSWSDPLTGGSNTSNSWGFLGGGQVGGNVQFNSLVLGVEGDFSWLGGMGLNNKTTDSIGNALSTKPNWTSTVTGRIGAAFDRLLIYGKGGLALAQDESSLTDLGGNVASTTLTRTGWTAGAGLEYALDNNWSARIEYDYLGFGNQALNFSTPLSPSYSTNANLNIQEVKAGLDFKFGP